MCIALHVYVCMIMATCSNACIMAMPLLRPQMASPRGGRNRGVLLYIRTVELLVFLVVFIYVCLYMYVMLLYVFIAQFIRSEHRLFL